MKLALKPTDIICFMHWTQCTSSNTVAFIKMVSE